MSDKLDSIIQIEPRIFNNLTRFESFVPDQEMSQLIQQSNITLSKQISETIKYVCRELFNRRPLDKLLGSSSNTQPLTF